MAYTPTNWLTGNTVTAAALNNIENALTLVSGQVVNVKDPAYGALGNGTANDTAAINAAISALTAGDTLYFPRGRYMTNGGHVISTPSVKIVGPSGRAQTYNSSAQLYLRNGANVDMLRLATNQITIRDLSLYGNFSNQGAISRGIVSTSADGPNYFLLDAVWVDSFNGDGISIDSTGTVSGTISNCECRVNQGFGLKVLGGGTDLQVLGGYIDQNTQSGIDCASGDLSVIGVHIWGNGTAATGDCDGITFHSAAYCRVEACFIEDNHYGSGAGIRFKTGSNKGHQIIGNDIWNNARNGISAFSADHCTIADNQVRHNNWSGQTGSGGAGITVDTCTAMLIENNMLFSVTTLRQTYGYYEIGTSNSDIRFEGNMSRAADHTTGGVFLGPATKADLGSAFVRMTADQSVTSSVTLVDATELTFPVVAGEVWELEGTLFCDGSQAGDLAVRIGPGGSPTGYWQALGVRGSATSTTAESIVPVANLFNTTATVGALGAGVIAPVQIHGLCTVSGSGTFGVKFAQGTSDATATILKAGSYLRGRRVAQ